MKFHVDRDEWWPMPEPAQDDEYAYWIVEMSEEEVDEWQRRFTAAKAELHALRQRLWDLDPETANEKRQRRHQIKQKRMAASSAEKEKQS